MNLEVVINLYYKSNMNLEVVINLYWLCRRVERLLHKSNYSLMKSLLALPQSRKTLAQVQYESRSCNKSLLQVQYESRSCNKSLLQV